MLNYLTFGITKVEVKNTSEMESTVKLMFVLIVPSSKKSSTDDKTTVLVTFQFNDLIDISSLGFLIILNNTSETGCAKRETLRLQFDLNQTIQN